MADWKEILSDNKDQISNEELLKYLDEETPEEEKYAIEKKMSDTSFESDAIEGLQKLQEPKEVQKHVQQLNKKLHQQLSHKKQRLEKGKIISFRWILLTIVILLFICIAGYVIIRMHNKSNPGAIHSSPGTGQSK